MKAAVSFFVALAMTASATAQESPAPELPAKVTFNCSRGFDALVADIRAKPNPRVFDDATETAIQVIPEHAIYTITKPGHYAYPAIVLTQFDVGQHGTITHESCGFGDKAGFARLLEDFKRRDLLQFIDGPAPAPTPKGQP
jgi:hypothetical protein